MRHSLGLALVLGLALGGCSGTRKDPAPPVPELAIKDVQVVWTRGGKLGYLKTYDARATDAQGRPGPVVAIHYVEDLEFRQVGWIANDGQAERYAYPPKAEAEARRVVFDRVPLPPGSLEDQVKRILQVEPTTELAFQRATEADFRR
ncbi:MAG: hypothetical protein HUU06_14075 [Planctomycetaceae bacterium]|nr:hypothetical protein [Planctomycetota bacterium]NUN53895.1 hypothetical protein [Planctomycetaceae bacterium]